ncbi:hypothetical protein KDX00_13980 [Cobetia amphilecti]|nr:hypothetical protein KDX00_13980 [Cobetia litoralis]
MREDLLKQCVIPPIVLALTNSDIVEGDCDSNKVKKIIANKDDLVILDGLQRTYTIFDLLTDLRENGNDSDLNKVLGTKLRVEIYVGLNRLGVLYRMLTLNTGQTPMSLRQQIEMLYLDYLGNCDSGVDLVREVDGRVANRTSQYNFKDVIEGFNAYLDRDELPIDKANILENINSLEKLSKENQSNDLFKSYVASLDKFILKAIDVSNSVEITSDYVDNKGTPFGKNAIQIFKKPQAFSGFGAAIGKLIDFKIVDSYSDIDDLINDIKCDDPELFVENINDALLWLKGNSKKIGNAQRTFFAFYFRDLFNPDTESFKDLEKAASTALRKYQAQNM